MAFEIAPIPKTPLPIAVHPKIQNTPVSPLRPVEEVQKENDIISRNRQLELLTEREEENLEMELLDDFESRRLEEETELALLVDKIEIERSAHFASEMSSATRVIVIGNLEIDVTA